MLESLDTPDESPPTGLSPPSVRASGAVAPSIEICEAPFSAKADAAVELGVPVSGALLEGWRGSTGGSCAAPSPLDERIEADCLFVSTRCGSAAANLLSNSTR